MYGWRWLDVEVRSPSNPMLHRATVLTGRAVSLFAARIIRTKTRTPIWLGEQRSRRSSLQALLRIGVVNEPITTRLLAHTRASPDHHCRVLSFQQIKIKKCSSEKELPAVG